MPPWELLLSSFLQTWLEIWSWLDQSRPRWDVLQRPLSCQWMCKHFSLVCWKELPNVAYLFDLQENDCDQINEMNLKNQIILLKDPSEFNKPKCYQEPSGECPSIINREKCQSKFSLCYEGWICEYTCKNNQVYNFKSNNCQELYSCQKSMREDLWPQIIKM